MKTHIVTVATHEKYYYKYLVKSCEKYNSTLKTLGKNEKWTGFYFKFNKMLKFLDNIDNDDLVCFVDGYDVVCVRDLNDLKDEFLKIQKETNCKIVVAHDKVVPYNIFTKWFFGTCKNLTINSGCYIGQSKDLKKILNKIKKLREKYNETDDQILLTKYCNSKPNNVYIDTECRLFFSYENPLLSVSSRYLDLNQKHIYYKQNRPFFIHGPGFTHLDDILNKEGYTIDKTIRRQHAINLTSKLKIYVVHILNDYQFELITLTLLIILFIRIKPFLMK